MKKGTFWSLFFARWRFAYAGLLGAGWLARRFSLGPWVYFAAIVLGLGAAACTFAEFVKMFRRKNGKK